LINSKTIKQRAVKLINGEYTVASKFLNGNNKDKFGNYTNQIQPQKEVLNLL